MTGERYLPYLEGNIKYEHLHRYALSRFLVKDKIVLDVASGEGYGAAALAQLAQSVVGIDIDQAAVKHAQQEYSAYSNLQFLVADCTALPLPDNSVEIVTSFETIEHHAKHQEMLSEIKRVLKANGLLILSSPNRVCYSEQPDYHNPFHVKELDYAELVSLLEKHFKYIQIYGQKIAEASFTVAMQPQGIVQKLLAFSGEADRLVQQSQPLKDPVYFIALCSNDPAVLSLDLNSFYSNWDNIVLPVVVSENRSKREPVPIPDKHTEQLETELLAVGNYVEDLLNHITQLNQKLANQNQLQTQIADLTRQLEASSNYIEDLHTHIYNCNAQFEELQQENKTNLNIQENLAHELKAAQLYIQALHQLTTDHLLKLSHLEKATNLYQQPFNSLAKRVLQKPQPQTDNAEPLYHSPRSKEAVRLVANGLRQLLHNSDIQGAIDLPLPKSLHHGTVEVSGWAIVRLGWVKRVEVLLDEVFLGTVSYGTARPDVLQYLPLQPDIACGFHGIVEYKANQVKAGPQILKVRVHSNHATVYEFCQTIQLDALKQDNLLASTENTALLMPDTQPFALQMERNVTIIRFFVTSLGNYFMQEIAQNFIEAFRANGFKVQLAIDEIPSMALPDHVWQVIVAPHDYYPLLIMEKCDPEQIVKINQQVYLLNVEQPGSRWFEIVAEVAKTAKGVWDINRLGLAEFKKRNIPVIYTPLGYTPALESSDTKGKKTDILFLGNSAPRRELFLSRNARFFNRYHCHFILARYDLPNFEHTPGFYVGQERNLLYKESRILLNVHSTNRKYFEWQRILSAMANHCLVITEESSGFEPLVPGEHFIMAELDQIPGLCQFYLENEIERLRLVNQAYDFITRHLNMEKMCNSLFVNHIVQEG